MFPPRMWRAAPLIRFSGMCRKGCLHPRCGNKPMCHDVCGPGAWSEAASKGAKHWCGENEESLKGPPIYVQFAKNVDPTPPTPGYLALEIHHPHDPGWKLLQVMLNVQDMRSLSCLPTRSSRLRTASIAVNSQRSSRAHCAVSICKPAIQPSVSSSIAADLTCSHVSAGDVPVAGCAAGPGRHDPAVRLPFPLLVLPSNRVKQCRRQVSSCISAWLLNPGCTCREPWSRMVHPEVQIASQSMPTHWC